MAEMTEARKAAWQAEEDRKKEQRLKTDRDRKRNATQKADDKFRMTLSELDNGDYLKQQSWLKNYLGPANFNGKQAAILAGYVEDDAILTGSRLKKQFAKKIAAYFEDVYLQKSAVVASLVNTWKGPGPYYVFKNRDEINWSATYDNLESKGLLELIASIKTDKDTGKIIEIKFRDPDQALGRIIQMTGLNAPVKIDLTATLAGKTDEEKRAIRQEGLRKVLALEQSDDIEYTEEIDINDGD